MISIRKNTMTDKQRGELELVSRLFEAFGYSSFRLEPSDRPDVIATIRRKTSTEHDLRRVQGAM